MLRSSILIFLIPFTAFALQPAKDKIKDKNKDKKDNTPAFQITKDNEANTLALTSKSCDEVIEIKNSLADWALKSKDHIVCPTNITPVKSKDKKSCTIDITNCVPEHVLKYQGVNPKETGPNCHNLVLVMQGIIPGMRYVRAEEFEFFMRPPLCRQLDENEQRMPGDVGRIKDFSGSFSLDSHGFIYISDKVVYSKNGFSNEVDRPYALQSFESVLKEYKVPKKSECRGNSSSSESGCPSALSFFRCQSFEEFIASGDFAKIVPQEVLSSYAKLSSIEKCALEPFLVQGSSLSPKAVEGISDVSNVLLAYLKQLKRNESGKTIDDETKYVLTAIRLHLSSIASSLDFANHKEEGLEVDDLAGLMFNEVHRLTY